MLEAVLENGRNPIALQKMDKIIQTSRLTLRPIVATDIEQVFQGLSHLDVIKYYGVSFLTLEATKEQMKWFADLEENETGQWWAVCEKKHDEIFRCWRTE